MIDVMPGCKNELAEKHLPQIAPREDTYGGPKGRRADMVSLTHTLTSERTS